MSPACIVHDLATDGRCVSCSFVEPEALRPPTLNPVKVTGGWRPGMPFCPEEWKIDGETPSNWQAHLNACSAEARENGGRWYSRAVRIDDRGEHKRWGTVPTWIPNTPAGREWIRLVESQPTRKWPDGHPPFTQSVTSAKSPDELENPESFPAVTGRVSRDMRGGRPRTQTAEGRRLNARNRKRRQRAGGGR